MFAQIDADQLAFMSVDAISGMTSGKIEYLAVAANSGWQPGLILFFVFLAFPSLYISSLKCARI
jgi:hypothetical protein